MSCSASGSDVAELRLGAGDGAFEMTVDADTMRALVAQATAAMAEMDALFEQEEAERVVAGDEDPGHHLVAP